MTESSFYSTFFILIGLFTIIASATDWNYFFNHIKAQFFVRIFGRTGARIFYLILGIALLSFGVLSLLGYISTNE
jgi:small neutral amino acid transporter SnatA (MarC family)